MRRVIEPPLTEEQRRQIAEEVEKQKYIAKYNPAAPFTGRVNVVADRRIPYRTLMEVLYTAGQAELGEELTPRFRGWLG